MLTEKIGRELNEQMNREFYSANLYLALSAWLDAHSLKGMAHWMRLQAEEEQEHGMKIFDFIQERGGQAIMGAIEAPPIEWESTLQVFEAAWEHERFITSHINELADLAIQEKDFATQSFLQWFITEQVEEEATTSGICDRLRIVGEDGRGILMIDQELGRRNFAPIPGIDLAAPLYP